MSKLGLPVFIVGCLALSGCGIFDGNESEHLRAEELPPVVVPEGKDTDAIGQIYAVPSLPNTVTNTEEFEVPRPLPVSQNVFEQTVKIQTYGDRSWILINKAPTEIWPRLRNILNRSAIPSQRVDASTGVIETGWIDFKDDEENSHRFRFTIEPGIPLNSSEVKILHLQTPVGEQQLLTEWTTSVSEDPDKEQEMLKLIANALASDISSGTVSLLAQSIGGETKVEVITPKAADPYIAMRLDYDRAWASVLYSLSRGGFSVTDQDQLAGQVMVSYQPQVEEDKPGFFGRLFRWGKKDNKEESFSVLLNRVERGVEIRITDTEKNSLDNDKASELLTIVRSNLS